MRQFERNGVTVDQCGECRGIFLDRGELEHLIDADAKFQGGGPPPMQAPPPPAPQRHHDDYRHEYRKDYGKHDRYYDDRGYDRRKKKKRSVFEELFD